MNFPFANPTILSPRSSLGPRAQVGIRRIFGLLHSAVICFFACIGTLQAQEYPGYVAPKPLSDQVPATHVLASVNPLPLGMVIFDSTSFYAVPGSIGVSAVLICNHTDDPTPSIEQLALDALPAEPAKRAVSSWGTQNNNALVAHTANTPSPQTNSSSNQGELVWRALPLSPFGPWGGSGGSIPTSKPCGVLYTLQAPSSLPNQPHTRIHDGHQRSLLEVNVDFWQSFGMLLTPSIDQVALDHWLFTPGMASNYANARLGATFIFALPQQPGFLIPHCANRPPPTAFPAFPLA